MGVWKRWRRQRILRESPIDEETWREVASHYAFLDRLSPPELTRLKELTILFLDAKHINAAGGLELDCKMRLGIAVQACLLILNLDLDYYKGWVEIIVYPDAFIPEREYTDEAGVLHVTREPLAGEAWLRGPVILSYADVARAGESDGVNVIIHEVAHKLDMLNGGANGYPPLHRGMSPETWAQVFEQAYKDFCARVEREEETSIDPYASENPAEFFAVLSEMFFEEPEIIKNDYPKVFEQLRLFYRQDPSSRR